MYCLGLKSGGNICDACSAFVASSCITFAKCLLVSSTSGLQRDNEVNTYSLSRTRIVSSQICRVVASFLAASNRWPSTLASHSVHYMDSSSTHLHTSPQLVLGTTPRRRDHIPKVWGSIGFRLPTEVSGK